MLLMLAGSFGAEGWKRENMRKGEVKKKKIKMKRKKSSLS